MKNKYKKWEDWEIAFLILTYPEFGGKSLDRIDSTKGYIEGNVQWIHKDLQFMKWNYSQEKFINTCKTVYKNTLPEYDDKTNDWW